MQCLHLWATCRDKKSKERQLVPGNGTLIVDVYGAKFLGLFQVRNINKYCPGFPGYFTAITRRGNYSVGKLNVPCTTSQCETVF